jgi:hypothetical protein
MLVDTSTWFSSFRRLSLLIFPWYCTIPVLLVFANKVLKAGLAPALLSLVLFYPPPCSYPTLFPFTLLGLL